MPEAYNQGAGLMPTVVGVMPGDVSKYAVVVSEKGGKLTDVTAKAPKMKDKKVNSIFTRKPITKFPRGMRAVRTSICWPTA